MGELAQECEPSLLLTPLIHLYSRTACSPIEPKDIRLLRLLDI